MQFPTLLLLPLLTPLAARDEPTNSTSPTQPNTCFSPDRGQCVGRQAPASDAHDAITKACEQIPTCTPGAPRTRVVVKGRMPGYTATLDLGNQCGGVEAEDWNSGNGCVKLFMVQIDERCRKVYPSDMFQLGYVRAPCDDTYISLNFGG